MDRGYADFHEKALFVKPTWRPLSVGRAQRLLPFALCFHPHSLGELALFGGSVHMMRSVFFGQRRCDLPSGLAGFRVDQVRWRSRLMLDPKRVRAQKPCVWR